MDEFLLLGSKKELTVDPATWMDLKNSTLSEKRKKVTHCVIPYASNDYATEMENNWKCLGLRGGVALQG